MNTKNAPILLMGGLTLDDLKQVSETENPRVANFAKSILSKVDEIYNSNNLTRRKALLADVVNLAILMSTDVLNHDLKVCASSNFPVCSFKNDEVYVWKRGDNNAPDKSISEHLSSPSCQNHAEN